MAIPSFIVWSIVAGFCWMSLGTHQRASKNVGFDVNRLLTQEMGVIQCGRFAHMKGVVGESIPANSPGSGCGPLMAGPVSGLRPRTADRRAGIEVVFRQTTPEE
jgi:hypothetical protein